MLWLMPIRFEPRKHTDSFHKLCQTDVPCRLKVYVEGIANDFIQLSIKAGATVSAVM